MTSSSGSTSKTAAAVLGLALGLGSLLGGGCAGRPHAASTPPVSGYADLQALVRRQPGWAGLGQYDAALARLDTLARNLPAAGRSDPKMARLSALPLAAEQDAGLGKGHVGEIAQHLSFVQETLLGSLDSRRRAARAEQLRRQQELWRRESRRLFPVPARTAAVSSDLEVQLLQTNIVALTETLSHWDNSKPPAPALIRLRLDVEADRRRLADLLAAGYQARTTARATRAQEIQRLRQARADYIQTQGDLLTARLEADDSRVLNAQTQRLGGQRLDLLAALSRPAPTSVPAAGNAGALALPDGPSAVQASLSAASLQAARARLAAQRARWVRYLVDDTRASALDAADQHHWNITFGPPRRGDRDMTVDLEHALAKG